MFKAIYRTLTEICDSKKAAYSFLNMIGACVLHLCFAVGVKDALFLVSPLTFLTLAQAYVDACAAKQQKPGTTLPFPVPLPPPAPVMPLPPPVPVVPLPPPVPVVPLPPPVPVVPLPPPATVVPLPPPATVVPLPPPATVVPPVSMGG